MCCGSSVGRTLSIASSSIDLLIIDLSDTVSFHVFIPDWERRWFDAGPQHQFSVDTGDLKLNLKIVSSLVLKRREVG